MFGLFKAIISNLVDNDGPRNEIEDCRLATAALLVRVATVEHEMTQARGRKLQAVLKSRFKLHDQAVAQLIEAAHAADRRAVDLYRFTRQLIALDDEDRRHIVRMMWEIIYVDGNANEAERNIVWRAADLLGISSRQRIELRRSVAAEGAVNPCDFSIAGAQQARTTVVPSARRLQIG
jgi:uncharacterized tellurite resistance protein B-like protein